MHACLHPSSLQPQQHASLRVGVSAADMLASTQAPSSSHHMGRLCHIAAPVHAPLASAAHTPPTPQAILAGPAYPGEQVALHAVPTAVPLQPAQESMLAKAASGMLLHVVAAAINHSRHISQATPAGIRWCACNHACVCMIQGTSPCCGCQGEVTKHT